MTLTPEYTEGINVAAAIMADPTETAPDGRTYNWAMNSASYFSVNEDGKVAIAEGGVLPLAFTVPEGEVPVTASQPDKSDATQALIDSGALPAAKYIFYNLDSLGYVANGHTDKVIKAENFDNLKFILDKIKLDAAGLSALSADKVDNTGTVSFMQDTLQRQPL